MGKRIGPALVAVSEARPAEGGSFSQSPVYRNILSENGFPEDFHGCTTTYEVFNHSVERFSTNKCIGARTVDAQGVAGPFEWITYADLAAKAKDVASGLRHIGAKPHAKIGVFAANCPEWMVAIRATDVLGGTIVPIYDSLGATAVEYICNHSELTVAIVEAPKLAAFAAAAASVKENVFAVVYLGAKNDAAITKIEAEGLKVYSWEEIQSLGAAHPAQPTPPKADDTACIMYTSGTTGTPKGVQLSHANLVAAVVGAHLMTNTQAGLNCNASDSMLSYLTLAHSYGRTMEEFALSIGGSIGYWQRDVKKLMDDIAELRPTIFVAVPRILERVVDSVEAKLKKGPGVIRAAFGAAFSAKLFLLRQGVPHWLAGLGVTELLFRKVRSALGGRVRLIVSGGAPLAPHIEEFCSTVLAPVLQGYGLTETCAGTFIMLPDPRMAHSVGPPLATAEFRLESVPELKYDATDESAPSGEVLVRGPMVFTGYYKDEKKYKEEVDREGWFHTGDIGTITKQGCLKIIDRKKNMFKLAQGEYVAVEYLEGIFSRTEAVDQIWVYGNSFESSLVAVVVPQHWWLKKADFGNLGIDQAVSNEDVKKAMLEELSKTGKEAKLKGFEMIRAVHLTTEAFSVDNDLQTQSLKLKRPQLLEKYKAEIDAMYSKMKASR